MPIPHSPRAPVSWSKPEPWAYCDRCNFQTLRSALTYQLQWGGPSLINLRLLVCCECLDKPQEQLRSIVIGPDPVPVKDPRPGFQNVEQGSTVAVPVQQIIGD